MNITLQRKQQFTNALISSITFTFCCFNSYHKTISNNQSSTNLYTDNMTAESFLEPKSVLDSVKRQYIGTEKNISFKTISAIYRDWLHSLGTRSAGKFLKVASTTLQSLQSPQSPLSILQV